MSHSLDSLKTQAKSLRQSLAETGHNVSHAQSLELLAKQLGHRDWNTLHAKVGNAPAVLFQVGQTVTGSYMGHTFKGILKQVNVLTDGAYHRLTVRFDAPIDVIPFAGMSNFRQQITATVDKNGVTAEKTSDGRPHLVLKM